MQIFIFSIGKTQIHVDDFRHPCCRCLFMMVHTLIYCGCCNGEFMFPRHCNSEHLYALVNVEVGILKYTPFSKKRS
jgi:hypothetical protein